MQNSLNFHTKKQQIPERINNILAKTCDFKLACICAPDGFGKSTIIKKYMEKLKANVLYISLNEEGFDLLSELLCDAAFEHSSARADYYIGKAFKTPAVRRRFMREVIKSAGDKETVIVIDNFHRAMSKQVRRLMLDLSDEPTGKARFILISNKMCFSETDIEVITGRVYTVNCFDLSLMPDEIMSFCHIKGKQGEERAKKLYRETGGYLSLLLHENSDFTKSITSRLCLLYAPIFSSLSEGGKKLLLYLSPCSCFTAEQAAFLQNKTSCADVIDEICEKTGLIIYDINTQCYKIHNSLHFYCNLLMEDNFKFLRTQVIKRNGIWQFQNKNYQRAVIFFRQAREYQLLTKAIECGGITNNSKKFIIEVYNEIPEKIKNEHPLMMIRFAEASLCFGEKRLFEETLYYLRKGLKSGYDKLFFDKILSYTELLLAANCFGDISEVRKHQKSAIEFSHGYIIDDFSAVPVTFGAPTVLENYYTGGNLSLFARRLSETEGTWNAIGGGCRKGFGNCALAEALYMGGDFTRAEIFTLRAISEAGEYQRSDILISAIFLDGRIALAKGDLIRFKNDVAKIIEISNESKTKKLVHLITADICMGFFNIKTGKADETADWLLCGKILHSEIYPYAMPAAYVVFFGILSIKKRYSELLAVYNEARDCAIRMKNKIALIYLNICASSANEALGMHEEAKMLLSDAFCIADESRITMPFVEYNSFILQILPEMGMDYEVFTALKRVISDYNKAINLIEEKNKSYNFPLTRREFEIAHLAAEGLQNQEIADKLFVTINTIKSALKGIFTKLDIYSRRELKEKLKKYNFNK